MKLTVGTGTAKDIASCCLISARMLELADDPMTEECKRPSIHQYNIKQAGLLRKCAAILMGNKEAELA